MKTKSITFFLSFFIVLVFNMLNTVNAQDNSNKFVVVLDAGHGGHDPGRPTKNGYTEKEIALKVVLEVGKLLDKNKDITVIYTRKTDVFIELHERANIANKADADLFVSIHCNAHHTQAYGTETYVLGVGNTDRNFNVAKAENEVIFLEENYEEHYEGYNPNSPESFIGLTLMQEEYVDQSIQLASLVEQNFKNKLKRKSRGVKQISLLVLRGTYMPSVLIETGFITNKTEGKYLNSKKGQQEISKSISSAVISYKMSLDHDISEFVINKDKDKPNSTDIQLEPTNSEEIYNNIIFKVQLAASSNKLEPKSYNFKGLKNISREKIGKLYKYYHGYTSDYIKIKQLQSDAKKKGYDTCFIVAYKEGAEIALKEALKTTVN